jgi:hypothetical protein
MEIVDEFIKKMESDTKMSNKEKYKKARQPANRNKTETEQEANIRRKCATEKRVERQSLETPNEVSIRRRSAAEKRLKREVSKLHMK